MANTYTQIYLHVVFAVSGRACVIQLKRKEELQKYIAGIVSGRNQKVIAINCMPDHTHILLGLKPNEAPSDLIGCIKAGSTNHINEQRWTGCRFSWQAFGPVFKNEAKLYGGSRRAAKTRVRLGKPGAYVKSALTAVNQAPAGLLRSQRPLALRASCLCLTL
jgi:REP-associated tyrosine transposase